MVPVWPASNEDQGQESQRAKRPKKNSNETEREQKNGADLKSVHLRDRGVPSDADERVMI